VSDELTAPEFELSRLLERLGGERVEFVVIGGIARIALGSPRFTKDLDICPALDRPNLKRLARALNSLNPKLRSEDEPVPVKLNAALLERTQVMTLETDAGWIDILHEPKGSGGYDALRRHAERIELDGYPVIVAAIDDQIAMKLASGRQLDLGDVEILRAIKRLGG
jgi:hypothetical protein